MSKFSRLLIGVIAATFCACAANRHQNPPPSPPPSTNNAAADTAQAAAAPTPTPAPAPSPHEALRRRASQVIDEGLAATDIAVRSEALAALGASRRSDALKQLTQALDAEQGEIRNAAARGLYYLQHSEADEPLVKAFKKEKGWFIRKELARAGASCGAQTMVPELKTVLNDPHLELRVAAAYALLDLADPAGETALAKLGNPVRKDVLKKGVDSWSRKVLSGQKEGDQVLAAKALAQVGNQDDVPLFTPLFDVQNIPLRVWAAAAVYRLTAAHPPVPAIMR